VRIAIGSILRLILFAGLIIFNLSCAKTDCLSGAGKHMTKSRNLEPFKNIQIYSYFNVYLKQDTINKIAIEAGEKEVENIETSITDSTLIIKDLNTCQFIKGYAEKKLYISVDTLTTLVIHDGINLYSIDTIKQKELSIRFLSDIGFCDLTFDGGNLDFEVWYSSGDFILRGKTESLYLNINELSFADASTLEAGSCYVYNNSMGDARVKTNGLLQVLLENSGNVYYSGFPSEIQLLEKTGSGKLFKNE
jgi:hypothetical protein